MENLAITLRLSGQVKEAKKLQQEVLQTLTEVFGSNHPYTIRAIACYAISPTLSDYLKDIGRFGQKGLKAITRAFRGHHSSNHQT